MSSTCPSDRSDRVQKKGGVAQASHRHPRWVASLQTSLLLLSLLSVYLLPFASLAVSSTDPITSAPPRQLVCYRQGDSVLELAELSPVVCVEEVAAWPGQLTRLSPSLSCTPTALPEDSHDRSLVVSSTGTDSSGCSDSIVKRVSLFIVSFIVSLLAVVPFPVLQVIFHTSPNK